MRDTFLLSDAIMRRGSQQSDLQVKINCGPVRPITWGYLAISIQSRLDFKKVYTKVY